MLPALISVRDLFRIDQFSGAGTEDAAQFIQCLTFSETIVINDIPKVSRLKEIFQVSLLFLRFFQDSQRHSAVERVLPDAGIMVAVNTGLADTAEPDSLRVLKGKDHIFEKIILNGADGQTEREVLFKLSPQSFFQTNTQTAQKMYARVRGVVKAIAPKRIYDLYGGAGSFSLCCADLCEKSICVESVAPAVYNGIENAKINNVQNVQFFCSRVEDFVRTQPLEKKDALIILDPPRSGMHPRAAKAVAESGVKRVLYISCNPVTLANDLKILTQHYDITDVEAFDFFPHSEHIETFVQLKIK